MTQQYKIPNISFVGKSNSGKTTLLEKVIIELKSRGLRVATVKHHSHPLDLDTPGKDSWRHAQAGADVTMLSSPGQLGIMRHYCEDASGKTEATLEEIAEEALLAGCDILITEGFKRIGVDRIELVRAERSQSLISDPADIIALVTDVETLEDEHAECMPVFGLADIAEIVDFIIQRYEVKTHEKDK